MTSASASFKLSSDAGASYAAVDQALTYAYALAYSASGTYACKAQLDSIADTVTRTWTFTSADDVHYASLPTITPSASGDSCTFSLPKTGGAWILTCTVTDGTTTKIAKSLKIAVLWSNGAELAAVGEAFEADPVVGWDKLFNAFAKLTGGAVTLAGDVTGASGANTVVKLQNRAMSSAAPSSGDVLTWSGSAWAAAAAAGISLGAAHQVYASDGATNAWNSTPSVQAIIDASAHPAGAGVLRTGNNTLAVQARNAANADDILLVGSGSDDKVYVGDAGAAGIVAQVASAGPHILKHGNRSTLTVSRSTEDVSFAVDAIATSIAWTYPITASATAGSVTHQAQESSTGGGGNFTISAGDGATRGGNVVLKAGASAGTPGYLDLWINGTSKFKVQSDGHTKIESLAGLIVGTSGVLSGLDGSWGDIAYRGTAGWQILTAGTSGQYLKTLGAGAAPAWATVSGGSFTAPSGTGLIHVTAGSMDATSSLGSANQVMVTNGAGTDAVWAALVNANVSSSAAIAVTKLALGSANMVLWSDGAANAFTASPILTSVSGTGTASASGFVRAANNVTIVAARNAANSGDLYCVTTDGSDNVAIGRSTLVAGVTFATANVTAGFIPLSVPAGLGTTLYGLQVSWVDATHRVGVAMQPATGTNKAGTHLRHFGGQPTGSASGGNIEFYLADTAGGSGTAVTAYNATPVIAAVYNSGANRVGILTVSPAATLDVNGTTKTTNLTISALTTNGVVKVSGGVGTCGSALLLNADVDAAAAINITKIAVTSQAQGDVLYFDGSNWARLAAGTSGYFLKTQGAAANPVWAAASGGSSPPTGTGLVHITAGAQDAASSIGAASTVMVTNAGATDTVWATIVNANISSSAAIVLSKIVNPTGTGFVKCTSGVFDAATTALIVNADITSATIAIAKLVVGSEGQSITCRGGTTPIYSENASTLLYTGTVSLIHTTGTYDSGALYTTPSSTNAVIEEVILVLSTAQVGASSSSAITVGTSAGASDLLTTWTIVPGTSINTQRGNDPTQLGTAMDPTKSYRLEVAATSAKAVHLRQVLTGATTTAGVLTVYVYGRILR